jgi:hypothetical protein
VINNGTTPETWPRDQHLDQLTGTVHNPGDPGYEGAVTGHDLAVAHAPALVVEATAPSGTQPPPVGR